MKRYQEVNWIVKLWRCRWYLAIPFIYVYYLWIGIKIREDEIVDGKLIHTENFFYANAKEIWTICIGMIQSKKMILYYTEEEVFEMFKDKFE